MLLHDVHPGYLSWARLLHPQERLADHRTCRPAEYRGAVREGAALLQGLGLCGQCGRRMGVCSLDDGVPAAAALLQVNVSTMADWCLTGQLEYSQETPHHPRWITLTPERLAVLRKPIRHRKPRHSPA